MDFLMIQCQLPSFNVDKMAFCMLVVFSVVLLRSYIGPPPLVGLGPIRSPMLL